MSDHVSDREAIADLVRTFFAAFTSGPDSAARLDRLRSIFLPEAVIVATCGREPTVYGVDSFIAPRQALLSGGTLVDFHEWGCAGTPRSSVTSPSTSAATPRRACRTGRRSRDAA